MENFTYFEKDKAYCSKCKTELVFDKDENMYSFQCNCYNYPGRKNFIIIRWCDSCQDFKCFRGLNKDSKCCSESAVAGGKALAKKNRENFSPEDWKNWTRRSCNSETANKSPESKKLNSGIKWCEVCKKKTPHMNNTCMKCHPSSGTGRPIGPEKAKEMRNLVRNPFDLNLLRDFSHNNIECNNLCQSYLNCNEKENRLKNKWGWCKESPNISKSNFITQNGVLQYYDKSVKAYVPWEEYKQKFQRKRVTHDIQTFINKLKSLDIFQPAVMGPIGSYDLNDVIQLVPTFRIQESQDWEGTKNAFEQSLVDMNVNWFTYVKFYISKDGRIRPLVVGKSGSLNVNSSGSDLSFSESIDDGPARKYLQDTGQTWDKTQILVIKAKSERQALYYEYYVQRVFELFES